jgi:hypothetical protein
MPNKIRQRQQARADLDTILDYIAVGKSERS